MNPQLQRALLLYQQQRFDQSAEELRQVLAHDPHDALPHALLSLCLARKPALEEATAEAQQAIHLAPDFPLAHYALASVWHDRRHFDQSLGSIHEAIRLDPGDADYHSLEAQIHLDQRRWAEALAAAARGLEQDAEHVACANLRAIALVKLGRKAEAGQAIDAALRRHPDNALTHANQGWACLEQIEPRKALEHFREALRLDPSNQWARAGLVEALKARHVVYGLVLRYFLWMAKLPAGVQLGVIVGGLLLNQMLGSAAQSHPSLAPWILPIRILYVTLAVLTWTADPLFNLLLRLSSYGRLALSEEQIRAANWFAMAVVPAVLSLGLCFVFGFNSIFLLLAMVFGFLMVPVAGSFKAATGWPRTLLMSYTIGLAAAGFGSIAIMVSGVLTGGETGKSVFQLGEGLLGLFVIGCVIYMWGANFIIPIQPKRS